MVLMLYVQQYKSATQVKLNSDQMPGTKIKSENVGDFHFKNQINSGGCSGKACGEEGRYFNWLILLYTCCT